MSISGTSRTMPCCSICFPDGRPTTPRGIASRSRIRKPCTGSPRRVESADAAIGPDSAGKNSPRSSSWCRLRKLGVSVTRLFIIRLALVLIVALHVLALALVRPALAPSDLADFPPPGRMIAVDGHQLHLQCTGAGVPTVILEE